jgi:hypothetical protein
VVPVVVIVPVVTIHVFTAPVVAVPVFVTIVIFFVTGSIMISKFPVVSALVGKTRKSVVTMRKSQSNFLFMENQ